MTIQDTKRVNDEIEKENTVHVFYFLKYLNDVKGKHDIKYGRS